MIDNSNKLIKLFSGIADIVFPVMNLLENINRSNSYLYLHGIPQ